MKRIALFVATNLAIMMLLMAIYTVLTRVFGLGGVFDEAGINAPGLITMSLVFGMGGAFISLLLSKTIAKWTCGAKVITGNEGDTQAWLVSTVQELARTANVGMPEVAIYEGGPNAFATGAFRNSALVAVSTGLIRAMPRSEIRAVLAHEMAHVANGDMVTLTLVQGVLNAVVIALSTVVGHLVDKKFFDKRGRGVGPGYFVVRMVMQMVLGILASLVVMAYSRRREYAADAGSANYLGSPSDMVAALRRLGGAAPGALPDAMQAFGISGKRKGSLFSSHPPIEARIARLQGQGYARDFR
ncbi:MAG: protease HtpX [Kiritimatiellaeota bacterium]|nr:protease HtpX [Kiritimatiellota bacterium]